MPSLSVLQEHSIGDLFTASVNNEDKGYDGLVEAIRGLNIKSEATEITEESDRSLISEEAYAGDTGQEEHENMREDIEERAEEDMGNDVKVQIMGHKVDLVMDQSLDVGKIIKNCVHGAAAMLEEENVSSQRKTERVSMLFSLMETAGSIIHLNIYLN